MITVLHRGGMPKWLQYYIGGGSLGSPKSDFVICARPLGGQGETDLGPGRSKAGALLHQVVDHLGKEVVTSASKLFSIWVLLTSQPFMDCTTLTIVTLRDTPQRQWTRTRPPVDRASWMNLIWWWPVVLRGQSFVMNIRRSLWTCG